MVRSEIDYWRDNYYELEERFNHMNNLHSDVNNNIQIELSEAKDEIKKLKNEIKEDKEYIKSCKKFIEQQEEEYKELNDKYQFVLTKLNNNPEMIKQTDAMIKYYNYMTREDRILSPVLWFIAGAVISIILFSIFSLWKTN